MDIFDLDEHIVSQYKNYATSFLTIRDPTIKNFVNQELAKSRHWPEPLLQLAPVYAPAETVAEFAESGALHPQCADIFRTGPKPSGASFRLHYHQREAINLARERKHFVVTTGTGSGKSLTYLIPIVDHILRHRPEAGRVRAIIVYPMNALINSQKEALEQFFRNLPEETRHIVRFDRYTGQESQDEKRRIQDNPPHILLTNYVMLELMLTRPDEFCFVDQNSADLQFIVLDELHTYRGRQGADVSLLMRRLRERSGNPNVLCIGTSATMVSSETTPDARRATVAGVASLIFGADISPGHVVEETLKRATSAHHQHPSPASLRHAVETPLPDQLDWETFSHHPLAIWIEEFFRVRARENNDDQFERIDPRRLSEGAAALAEKTGLSQDQCEKRIRHFIQLASTVEDSNGTTGFAFKLHQFLSQGGAVSITLEPPDRRFMTLEEQRFVAGESGNRLLFPLVFCRECGQEYCPCLYNVHESTIAPLSFHSMIRQDIPDDQSSITGYLLPDAEAWSDDDIERFPDTWFRNTKKGRSLKKEYRRVCPRLLYVTPTGEVSNTPIDHAIPVWFMSAPFLVCLRCGIVHTKQQTDFFKLTGLSNQGRSTATTLVSLTAIDGMHRMESLSEKAKKLLSFTDNRQDASLQAGHFNDFTAVVVLRAAIYRAINDRQKVSYAEIPQAVYQALNLKQEDFAKDAATEEHAIKWNEQAIKHVLEYRIFADLQRGWRVTQPNLEQCGLVRIEYQGLRQLCERAEPWAANSLLAATPPEKRYEIIHALVDHIRRDLAIDAPILDSAQQEKIYRDVQAKLNEKWRFEESDAGKLRSATVFVRKSETTDSPERNRKRQPSLSYRRSLVGRFLCSPLTWSQRTSSLDEREYEDVLDTILRALVGANILTDGSNGKLEQVQLRADALLWCVGDETMPPLDPIRTRRIRPGDPQEPSEERREGNHFFRTLYQSPPENIHQIVGREHTGQSRAEDRQYREQQFRDGDLSTLFCSPTMELGIDISDLNMVHMRNIPPTPANYAQRSGRAGRSGQPALVVAYAAYGNSHDQYFFRRPTQMVAGQVAAPQIDLINEHLIRTHVHAIWLSTTVLQMKESMVDVLDIADSELRLLPDIQEKIQLSEEQIQWCQAMAKRVLDACPEDLHDADWFHDDWLATTLQDAPEKFDRACDRWRNLYRAAKNQLQSARNTIDREHQKQKMDQKTVNDAEHRQKEALRQIDLLRNNRNQGDSDFYPYRYFASEGFLPGYNFPSLPIRAFIPIDDRGEFLVRPRALAITEFGPHNIIYHEGGKFRVTRSLLPPTTEPGEMFFSVTTCNMCGYFHHDHGNRADICKHCGNPLSGSQATRFTKLFEMRNVATERIERITCEEEVRRRQGFQTSTHYQFAPDSSCLRSIEAEARSPMGAESPLLSLTYAPAATIWFLNHGWRSYGRTQGNLPEGFTIDPSTGEWQSQKGDTEPNSSVRTKITTQRDRQQISGIRLVVRDTHNLLLIQQAALPAPDHHVNQESVVASLQYALQRGIEHTFQLEEQELRSERVGEGNHRRILLWESAEGGAGVLRRLVADSDALARVARTALELCHYDPDTGEENGDEAGECICACYRCLLSYGNQREHALLDRRLIRDLLRDLMGAQLVQTSASPEPPDESAWDEPSLAPPIRAVLAALRESKRRRPDAVNRVIAGHTVHLFYTPTYCVFCTDHGYLEQAILRDLEDEGYLGIVLRGDRDLEQQLQRYEFWGKGS